MLFLLSLLLSFSAHADVPITGLPLGAAAASGVNDVFPFVDVTSLTTKKMKLSDLKNLPSFATFNAATATSLAAAPSTCGGATFAKGILANGNAICGTPSGSGGSGLAVSTISASGSLTAGSSPNYQHIACDATGAPVVAALPLCLGPIVGQVFNLKKIDSSSNTCSFAASGPDLIDGQTSRSVPEQYTGVTVVCRSAGFWDIL